MKRFSNIILTDSLLVIAAVLIHFLIQWCDNTNKDFAINIFTDAEIEMHAKCSKYHT